MTQIQMINFSNVIINLLTHWSHYYVILNRSKRQTKEETFFFSPFQTLRSSIITILEKDVDMLKLGGHQHWSVALECGQL